MALHDYRCPACGAVKRDVYVPITTRATAVVLICRDCAEHRHQGVQLDWIPQVGRMDAGSVKSVNFQAFDVERRQPDGSYRTERVTSVHQMRRIERESEIAHRNGEGEALRFRMWSQDAANGDVNTFGPDPGAIAKETLTTWQADRAAKQKRLHETIRGARAEENARTLGPGVTETSASPLSVVD